MAKRVLNGGKPWSVMVGVSYGRTYEEADFVHALFLGLFGSHWQRDIENPPTLLYEPKGNDALVSRSRSYIMTRFLEHPRKPSVLLTLDTDIGFNPLDVILLAEQAVREQAVYCGLYVTRSKAKPSITSWLDRSDPIDLGGTQTKATLRWGATGCMAVPYAVPEALAKGLPLLHADQPEMRLYPFYMPFPGESEVGTPIYLSEDYAFCERARAAGFAILANPSLRLAHYGKHPFAFEDLVVQPRPTLPIVAERIAERTISYASDAVAVETESVTHIAPDKTETREAVPV